MHCATPPARADVAAGAGHRESSHRVHWTAWLWLSAIALLTFTLALRGLPGAEPAFPDASRHVMNAALIHDMIRDGGYKDPVAYARTYYTHAPALSLPYHPPVFPAMEAVAFAVFGVRYDVARVLTALTAVVSVLLLGVLALRTHGSAAIASLAVAGFVLLPFNQWVAHEVMLEFPSMMFIAGAFLALARALPAGAFTNATAFWYAALTVVAFWTKQHAVFVAAVPFAYIVLARQWRLLRDWRLWAASLTIGGSVVAYSLLVRLTSTGSPTVWKYKPLHQVVLHHIDFYGGALLKETGWLGVAAVVVAVVFHAARAVRGRELRGDALFGAWALCYTGFILVITPWDTRYLYYLAPAACVLVFSAIDGIVPRRVWVPACAIAVLAAAWTTRRTPDRIEGFYAAARSVIAMEPKRILVCSATRNGTFTVGLRTMQPRLDSVVVRGDALPKEFFDPAKLPAFLHDYGIDAVVIEDTPADEPWDTVRHAAMPALRLRETVAVKAQNLAGGELLVYAHTNPSATPKSSLKLGSTMVGGGVEVELR